MDRQWTRLGNINTTLRLNGSTKGDFGRPSLLCGVGGGLIRVTDVSNIVLTGIRRALASTPLQGTCPTSTAAGQVLGLVADWPGRGIEGPCGAFRCKLAR